MADSFEISGHSRRLWWALAVAVGIIVVLGSWEPDGGASIAQIDWS